MKKKSKKSGKIIKKHWKVCLLMVILIGSLSQLSLFAEESVAKSSTKADSESREGKEAANKIAELKAELAMNRQELEFLRKELADVLLQSDKHDREYLRLQASIASSAAEEKKNVYGKKSVEILESLADVQDAGKELILCIQDSMDFIQKILEKDKITDVDRARSQIRISKLRKYAEDFNIRIQKRSDNSLFRSCRVLDINDKLQLVLLNVGASSGVRNGIMLKNEDGSCKLKIVVVKPYISAAMITKGSLDDLARGLVLYPGD
jgi:hypothetical protein